MNIVRQFLGLHQVPSVLQWAKTTGEVLFHLGDTDLLTESEVQRSYRKLMRGQEVAAELLDKAESLLDQLRPESPLRHRLWTELDELREMSLSEK